MSAGGVENLATRLRASRESSRVWLATPCTVFDMISEEHSSFSIGFTFRASTCAGRAEGFRRARGAVWVGSIGRDPPRSSPQPPLESKGGWRRVRDSGDLEGWLSPCRGSSPRSGASPPPSREGTRPRRRGRPSGRARRAGRRTSCAIPAGTRTPWCGAMEWGEQGVGRSPARLSAAEGGGRLWQADGWQVVSRWWARPSVARAPPALQGRCPSSPEVRAAGASSRPGRRRRQ